MSEGRSDAVIHSVDVVMMWSSRVRVQETVLWSSLRRDRRVSSIYCSSQCC